MRVARGIVPGALTEDAAIRLAGALAELGEDRIEVNRKGAAPRRLDPRRTDLPGEIAALALVGGGTLSCAALGLTIEVGRDQLEWSSDNPDAARRLREALRD